MSKLVILFMTLLLLPLTVSATDLYELHISSQPEAELINSLNLHLLQKTENGYLVLIESEMVDRLFNSNISFDLVYSDVLLDQLLIGTNRAELKSERYPEIYNGSGIRLLFNADGAANYDLSATNVVPLTERDKKVSYIESKVRPLEDEFLLPDGIDTIMAKISQDSLESYLYRLEAFYRRLAGTDSNYAARDWIQSKFIEFGYDSVVIDPFIGSQLWERIPVQCYNVYAVKVGSVHPETQIVIGGHFDAVPDCPGADDNGTGTAATLELARVLKDIETEKTIVFIAFDSEESWLWGSYHYVDSAVARGDDIELMVNLDMIGHYLNSDSANIYHGDNDVFARLWNQISNNYQGINAALAYSVASDHMPFLEAGYDVIFVQEGNFSNRYHQPDDSTTYVNFEYMTRMVEATVGVVHTVDVSFTQAPNILFDLISAEPELIDPVLPTICQLQLTSSYGGVIVPGTCMLNYSTDGLNYATYLMTEISAGIYEAKLPEEVGCMNTIDYYFTAEEATQGILSSSSYTSIVSDSVNFLFYDHFETDLGWDGVEPYMGFEPWDRAIPVSSYWGPWSDADGSGYCYLTDASGDYFTTGFYQLTSPLFSMADESYISYYYYLNLGLENSTDKMVVLINSNNGEGNWTELRHYNQSTKYVNVGAPWCADTIAFTELVDLGIPLTDSMVIRFLASSELYESYYLEAGLDRFEVKKFYCDDDEIKLTCANRLGPKPLSVSIACTTRHDAMDYLWDFGDGYTTTDISPSHIYDTTGLYDLSVEINTPYGMYNQTFDNYFGVHSDTIETVDVYGQPTAIVSMDIRLNNFVPLSNITIPVQFNGPLPLSCRGYSTTGLRSELMDFNIINFDNFNRRAIFELSGNEGNELSIGEGPVLTLDFEIKGTNDMDTTFITFDEYNSTPLELVTASGVYQPSIMIGKIYIGGCCYGIRGNIDNDPEDIIDVSDLVFMVDYQFRGGDAPVCFEESDIVVDDVIDVSDLVFMVDYQFRNGDEPPGCF